jgi:flagellar M-ring protein FliF
VRVSAEIDTAVMSTVEEKFDPDGQVPRSATTTEDTSITSEKTPGLKPAGVGSNIPGDSDPNAGNNPLKSTEDNRKNKTEVYEINKVTTNMQKSPGAIRRLTAAVFLAQREKTSPNDAAPPARSAAEIDSLRQMVVNALGIQAATPEEMSKIVSLQEVAFQPTTVDVTPTPERIMRYVEVVRPLLTVLLAGGIFLFFVWMLRRTKATEGRFELLDPTNNKLLTNSESSSRIGHQSISPEVLNVLIKQKPDNVAAALSGWLAQKEGKES